MSSRLEDQRAGYCRHCGDRLPLIKRVKREDFCSEEHRELFLSSTKIVALDRLRESDAQIHAEPQAAHETSRDRVAVAEMAAPAEAAPPEPPDPPMAGTIGPGAMDSPLRLMTLFDSEEHRIGLWEPVRPEPQWHNIALHFGLAEFRGTAPVPMDEESSEQARTIDEPSPALVQAEMAMPGRAPQLTAIGDLSVDDTLASDSTDGGEEHEAPAELWAHVAGMMPNCQSMTAHRMAPMAEPLDLDTMLYLPGFSPEAERESLGGRGWGPADWVSGEAPVVQNGASRLETILPGEPLYAEIALEPLLGSGCSIVAADLSAEGVDAGEAEAELDDQTQVEAAPDSAHDLPAFVAESNDLDEFALESEIEVGAAVGERANAAETPASIDWEERGMSEAVQSRTDQGSLAGLQALGERIANPFLHEPQPRPGSGTPRWTPATAALGTGAPLATEDWDIL